ncbi:MAG: RimK family alpha-L-glutamate ligase [Acidobacteria bacterium]|nr:RimK family alpha-L-glutamate ligase [Acidobacteriota bacterium]
MNTIILSRSAHIYSTQRLALVCRARGHQVRVIDPLRCSIVLRPAGGEVLLDGEPLQPVDAVIPRIGRSTSFYSLAVLRQFESAGSFCLNGSRSVALARDKLNALQALAAAGLSMVPTAFARHPRGVRQAVADIGGLPCVVKVTDGSQGFGVMLAESGPAVESIVEAFHNVRQNILLQQYVRSDGDLRLLVVGRRVVAAMRRRARDGDFRTNLHRGGFAEVHRATELECRIALRATRAVGLDVAGVDLIEGPQGPLLLEVNASPGLRGIESASGRNVASAIVRLLESRLRARRPQPAPAIGHP